MRFKYTSEEFSITLSAEEYIKKFRDKEKFFGYCRECGQYGRSWTCPPFETDYDKILNEYKYVTLWLVKVKPLEPGIPFNLSRQFLLPERVKADKKLRKLEKDYDGISFSYVGSCIYCPEGRCNRPSGGKCLHPDLVRPSLEGIGFDIIRTAKELFDIDILWSAEGSLPTYLTLVSGIFHNKLHP